MNQSPWTSCTFPSLPPLFTGYCCRPVAGSVFSLLLSIFIDLDWLPPDQLFFFSLFFFLRKRHHGKLHRLLCTDLGQSDPLNNSFIAPITIYYKWLLSLDLPSTPPLNYLLFPLVLCYLLLLLSLLLIFLITIVYFITWTSNPLWDLLLSS